MTAYEIVIIIFSGSLIAGFLGSLSGLGGGLIIVPLLVLGVNVDIHYAIGASLIAVIATSTGASSAYVREGFSNIRVALLLETATTIGALVGVVIAAQMSAPLLSILFGTILLYCSFASFYANGSDDHAFPPDKIATFFKLNSYYPTASGNKPYQVQHLPWGYLVMFIAGGLSALLGIGSGALKVLALDKIMKLPFKVSATTSNFMIGVTATASAGIYLHLGYIDPLLTMPVVLGVIIGSLSGARLLPYIKTNTLKYLFAGLILAIAAQMIYKGLHGMI